MPSLILFRRRWRIGSDDFVFPGIFEALIRIIWLILSIFLFVEHLNDSQSVDPGKSRSCQKGEILIRIYLSGVLCILVTALLLSVALVIHSSRGTIMVTSPRKHVSKILFGRVVLGVFEVGWNILGTVWLHSKLVSCESDSSLWVLLEALVVFTWVALPLLIVTALILFEPMMRPESEDSSIPRPTSILDRTNSGIGSHYIQLWERRCRILCCTFSRDENSAEAFRNVADVLASLFEDSDLVASDIASAFVLLRLRRKFEENQTGANRLPKSISDLKETLFEPPEWMTLANAYHYMKFALGSYGWPWYVYGHIATALLKMRPYFKCCSCCRPSTGVNSKDNCCECNLAALRAITNIPEENIVYLSFHNKIYETPFFVAIDDESKHVVVSIRGTLSLHDAITDLNAQCTLLSYEGLPEGSHAHKGMVNVAQFVNRQLEESNAIPEALSRRQGYGLVITGHSLGAGAAVILAAMLRPLYPNVKCFAFSPPGGLCSIEMYAATQSFVMSVVVGDDIVPRLSLASIHDLHCKINNVLTACKKPKYRVLAKGCWYMLFGIPKSTLLMSGITEANSNDRLLATSEAGSFSYVSPHSVEEESIQDIRTIFLEGPRQPAPRHLETLLFPPGKILYLKVKHGTVTKESDWSLHWMGNCDFQEILITPSMLRHHLPQVVLEALSTALNNQSSSIPP